MKLSETRQGGIAVITVSGDIDRLTVDALDQRLFGDFERGTSYVVLDLHDCHYVDAAGIAVLFAELSRLPRGGMLAIAGPDAQIRRLFGIVGLPELPNFAFYKDVPAAITALSRRQKERVV